MKKGISFILILVIISQPLFSKPYAPIPGTKDKFDSEATIQSLLAIKQIPIDAKENEIENYKIETGILQDFNAYAGRLDDQTKALYNIKSPFREMLGESSDPQVVEATANRTAIKKDYKVKVIQIAQADQFMSASLPRNKRLSPAQFTIRIGEDTYPIRFAGGTLHQLAQTIQDQTDGKLETRVINDTSTTSVLQVSGKQTGAKYRMQFEGDLAPLFEAELLYKAVSQTITRDVDLRAIVSSSTNRIVSDTRSATLVPLSQGELNLNSAAIRISNTTVFYWSAERSQQLPVSITVPTNTKPSLPDLSISPMQEVNISNIIVEGDTLIPFYQKKTPPPAVKETVSNRTEVFTLHWSDGSSTVFSVTSNGNFSRPVQSWTGLSLQRIQFHNYNTIEKYRLYDFRFLTPVEEDGLRPKNFISRAQDAVFTIDGVQITREKNAVDDVVEGLVIYLKKPSSQDVDLKIDHNYKLVMDSILEWVNTYNQVMEYLSILTKPNQDRTPLYLKAEKDRKTGLFQAESSFSSLQNKLRLSVMNSYATEFGRELNMLEQIGIFTKEAGSFSTSSDVWESTRMGLLNVDTDKLNSKLVTQFEGVRQLFANAKDGGFTGVAWEVSQVLRLALGAGGFLARKIQFNDNRIKETQKTVAKMKEDLEDYEVQIRIQYGKLNQTINQTDKQKDYWNNMNRNNN